MGTFTAPWRLLRTSPARFARPQANLLRPHAILLCPGSSPGPRRGLRRRKGSQGSPRSIWVHQRKPFCVVRGVPRAQQDRVRAQQVRFRAREARRGSPGKFPGRRKSSQRIAPVDLTAPAQALLHGNGMCPRRGHTRFAPNSKRTKHPEQLADCIVLQHLPTVLPPGAQWGSVGAQCRPPHPQ